MKGHREGKKSSLLLLSDLKKNCNEQTNKKYSQKTALTYESNISEDFFGYSKNPSSQSPIPISYFPSSSIQMLTLEFRGLDLLNRQKLTLVPVLTSSFHCFPQDSLVP